MWLLVEPVIQFTQIKERTMITDKTLYDICEPVTDFKEAVEIAKEMLQTIYDNPERHGVGIAANQIGYNKRIIVINTPMTKGIMVNPKIIKMSKQTTLQQEGCLSFPADFLVSVERSKQITVEWTAIRLSLGLTTLTKVTKFRSLDARVVQHEIDHLNGITIKEYA